MQCSQQRTFGQISNWFENIEVNQCKNHFIYQFQTAWEIFRFLRLPFGISPAPEVFHKVVCDAFQDIDNVATFQDDVLRWAESEEKLQETLCKVLEKVKENQIKSNPQKCLFFVKGVTFLGHNISEKGISIDHEKVKAITELEPPKDKKHCSEIETWNV